jgi:hypothetical protein
VRPKENTWKFLETTCRNINPKSLLLRRFKLNTTLFTSSFGTSGEIH